MPINTLDFHIHRRNQTFRLELYLRGNSERLAATDFKLPTDFLALFELRELDFDIKDPAARVERLREYGGRLYELLFTPDVNRAWQKLKQASDFLVICARIAREANVLEAIPWEALWDGNEFLAAGAKTTISRLPLDVEPRSNLVPIVGPVRMLAFVSSPLDLPENSRLQIEREQEILLEAINDPAGQGQICLDLEDDARLKALARRLEIPYQIFHYSGHGIPPKKGGGLLLEDEKGRSRPTSVTEVLQCLQLAEESLRLVVLSGCQTADTIDLSGLSDLARGLLRRRIPAVVAMQFSISDAGGLAFAEVFYSQVAAGCSLEIAVHAARQTLVTSGDCILEGDGLAVILLVANGECLQMSETPASAKAIPPKTDRNFGLSLPQLSYGFYGRRREYREIRDGFLQRQQRAVIIHGLGGIGKTAFVSYAATRISEHFQGMYAFDCSSGTLSHTGVIAKLRPYFAARGIDALQPLQYQSPSPESLAASLAEVFSQFSMLVIFDNFDNQLARDDEGFRIADENLRSFIATLIEKTADSSYFLFTSRYLFKLDGADTLKVRTINLGDLSRPEAVSLMLRLQSLAPIAYSEKLRALSTFGGHPHALITLNDYGRDHSIRVALDEAKVIHSELRRFLGIEPNFDQLSEDAQELLNRLAAFRGPVAHEALDWIQGRLDFPEDELQHIREVVTTELPQVDLLDDASLRKILYAGAVAEATEELINCGLLTSIGNDDEGKAIAVHALVRDFCRARLAPETWRTYLRDAAAFFSRPAMEEWNIGGQTLKVGSVDALRELSRPDKPEATVWAEMESYELLMEAGDYEQAAQLLLIDSPLLDRWGFGQYLEFQYGRLCGKLGPSATTRVFLNLADLAEQNGDYDQALDFSHRSLKLAEEMRDSPASANALHQIGVIHQQRGNFEQALQAYEHALDIRKQNDERSDMATSFHQIGIIQRHRGEFKPALENFNRALEIKEQLGEISQVAIALHQIGNVYLDLHNHEKALEHYDRSLKILEDTHDRSGMGRSLHQIANIHYVQGHYESALAYYERSLAIKEALDDRAGMASSLHQIGMIYHQLKNFDRALNYYDRALAISEQLSQHSLASASSLTQMGAVFTDLERYDEALRSLIFALDIMLELKSVQIAWTIMYLKELREKWGRRNFERAWHKALGVDVPKWLNEQMEVVSR